MQHRDRSPEQIAEWIVQARQGSAQALGQLMQFSRQYLLVIANAELPDRLQAKVGPSDLVQEAQLEATRNFARFRGHTPAELLAWLREILLHDLQDCHRRFTGVTKRQVDREISLTELASGSGLSNGLAADESSPSARLQREELAAKVEAALLQLSTEYRQVILWHHRESLSFEEIGERLGRSTGAVRKLWSRAIRQLQQRSQTGHGRD